MYLLNSRKSRGSLGVSEDAWAKTNAMLEFNASRALARSETYRIQFKLQLTRTVAEHSSNSMPKETSSISCSLFGPILLCPHAGRTPPSQLVQDLLPSLQTAWTKIIFLFRRFNPTVGPFKLGNQLCEHSLQRRHEYFNQFGRSRVTGPKISEKFRTSQGHRGSVRKGPLERKLPHYLAGAALRGRCHPLVTDTNQGGTATAIDALSRDWPDWGSAAPKRGLQVGIEWGKHFFCVLTADSGTWRPTAQSMTMVASRLYSAENQVHYDKFRKQFARRM
ncbi:hypothetical protein GGX14DRAFT_404769 [Mycena pura]|uniref:Uncharacterized protein n=1 Tax=Mycena pura TaxID=153505 RepID=A0AAD6UT82_9AGAR|nr:hypothetical protein GGX14DRAFT_404769 [Mycena pura]